MGRFLTGRRDITKSNPSKDDWEQYYSALSELRSKYKYPIQYDMRDSIEKRKRYWRRNALISLVRKIRMRPPTIENEYLSFKERVCLDRANKVRQWIKSRINGFSRNHLDIVCLDHKKVIVNIRITSYVIDYNKEMDYILTNYFNHKIFSNKLIIKAEETDLETEYGVRSIKATYVNKVTNYAPTFEKGYLALHESFSSLGKTPAGVYRGVLKKLTNYTVKRLEL